MYSFTTDEMIADIENLSGKTEAQRKLTLKFIKRITNYSEITYQLSLVSQIDFLLPYLNDLDPKIKRYAIGILRNLIYHKRFLNIAAFENVLMPLLFFSLRVESEKLILKTIETLVFMSKNYPEMTEKISNSENIRLLFFLLHSDNKKIVQYALWLIGVIIHPDNESYFDFPKIKIYKKFFVKNVNLIREMVDEIFWHSLSLFTRGSNVNINLITNFLDYYLEDNIPPPVFAIQQGFIFDDWTLLVKSESLNIQIFTLNNIKYIIETNKVEYEKVIPREEHVTAWMHRLFSPSKEMQKYSALVLDDLIDRKPSCIDTIIGNFSSFLFWIDLLIDCQILEKNRLILRILNDLICKNIDFIIRASHVQLLIKFLDIADNVLLCRAISAVKNIACLSDANKKVFFDSKIIKKLLSNLENDHISTLSSLTILSVVGPDIFFDDSLLDNQYFLYFFRLFFHQDEEIKIKISKFFEFYKIFSPELLQKALVHLLCDAETRNLAAEKLSQCIYCCLSDNSQKPIKKYFRLIAFELSTERWVEMIRVRDMTIFLKAILIQILGYLAASGKSNQDIIMQNDGLTWLVRQLDVEKENLSLLKFTLIALDRVIHNNNQAILATINLGGITYLEFIGCFDVDPVIYHKAKKIINICRFLSQKNMNKSIQNIRIQDLSITPFPLAHGRFSTVSRAVWNNSDVAVKIFKERDINESSFFSEVKIHHSLSHPRIVDFYGICIEGSERILVMELMERDLYTALQDKSKSFSLKQKMRIALDIALAVEYLHCCNIIHRDLKSLNILLDSRYRAKMGDFGLSKIKRYLRSSCATGGAAGSIPWMAPELLENENVPCTRSTDIFSLAIIFWELISEEIPYKKDCGNTEKKIKEFVLAKKRQKIPEDTPIAYSNLINQGWSPEAKRRPKAKEIVEKLSQYLSTLECEVNNNNKLDRFSQSMSTMLEKLPNNATYKKNIFKLFTNNNTNDDDIEYFSNNEEDNHSFYGLTAEFL